MKTKLVAIILFCIPGIVITCKQIFFVKIMINTQITLNKFHLPDLNEITKKTFKEFYCELNIHAYSNILKHFK